MNQINILEEAIALVQAYQSQKGGHFVLDANSGTAQRCFEAILWTGMLEETDFSVHPAEQEILSKAYDGISFYGGESTIPEEQYEKILPEVIKALRYVIQERRMQDMAPSADQSLGL